MGVVMMGGEGRKETLRVCMLGRGEEDDSFFY